MRQLTILETQNANGGSAAAVAIGIAAVGVIAAITTPYNGPVYTGVYVDPWYYSPSVIYYDTPVYTDVYYTPTYDGYYVDTYTYY